MALRRRISPLQWTLLAVVVLAVAGGAWAAVRMSRPAVVVTPLVEAEAVQAFYATGTLEPADREHPVRSFVPGFVRPPTETGRLIDKGDFVRAGEPIAVIYNDQYALTLAKAKADLAEKTARADAATSPVLIGLDRQVASAEEKARVAQSEVDRLTPGLSQGTTSQAELNRAVDKLQAERSLLEGLRSERGQAKLRLDRELAESRSALDVAQWMQDRTVIRAPVSGYAMDKPAQPGTRVGENDLIVTIADTSPGNLVMRAQVDEEDVTKVWAPPPKLPPAGQWFGAFAAVTALMPPDRQPQVVRMSLYAFADRDRPFTGHVVRIYPKADPDRRTFEVDVAIDDPSPRMQAGMTGELAFETARKSRAVVAPSQALQGGRFWVIRDGKLTPAEATPGLRSVERVEVATGLKPGDQVVISPVAALEPGTRVRVGQVQDPTAAAEANRPKKKELFRGGF